MVQSKIIPDLLALVGDAADGYPGVAGIGARTGEADWGQISTFDIHFFDLGL